MNNPLSDLRAKMEVRWPSLPYLSFGALWAWSDLIHSSPIVMTGGVAQLSIIMSEISVVPIVLTVAMLLFSLFSAKVEPFFSRNVVPLLSSIMVMGGTIIVVLGAHGFLNSSLVFVGSALSEIGIVITYLCYAIKYVKLETRQLFLYVALARILSGLIVFVVLGIDLAIGVVILVSLPLLCTFFLTSPNEGARDFAAPSSILNSESVFQKENRIHSSDPESQQASGHHSGNIIQLLATCFLLLILLSQPIPQSITVIDPANETQLLPTVTLYTIIVFLIATLVIIDESVDLARLLRSLFIVVVLLTLVKSVLAISFVSIVSILHISNSIIRNVVDLAFFVLAILLVRSLNSSPVRIVGLLYGAWGLGSFTSSLLWHLPSVLSLTNESSSLLRMAVLVILGIILAVMILSKRVERLLFLANNKSEQEHRVKAPESLVKASAQYNLSDREIEVLSLILSGHTVRLVSNELYISTNTAKSHIRSIYNKIGVASREELIMKLKSF